ncbi:sulfur carrier protein ThiS [Dehalococcoidia bacterium]|nr:sulfur carrier protein ThiS [Dehalococcoidia bacterium]
MINIKINGQDNDIEEGSYIADYLNQIQVDIKFIAVAHNGEVIEKDDYAKTVLNEGDKLEIVRPVGGG